MPSPPKDPRIGRTIAQRYRLISLLGAGAVASVYLARHVLIERLGACLMGGTRYQGRRANRCQQRKTER